MNWKDLFSAQAGDYARFRPTYPESLFQFLADVAPARDVAIDVGTGNGQAARALAAFFTRVVALDPSAEQLKQAEPHPRVEYRRAPAEALAIEDHAASLLTVAQAFHWFDQPKFFAEAKRVLRPGGVLAFWCYGKTHVTPEVDVAVEELYEDRFGPYWDPARRLVEQGYKNEVVPFSPIETPAFALDVTWTLEHWLGYLGTWSPRPRYAEAHGHDAVAELTPKISTAWGNAPNRKVTWPISLRAFRL